MVRDAKQFAELEKQRERLTEQIGGIEKLLCDEATIRQNAIRKGVLDRVLPYLGRIHDARDRYAKAHSKVQTSQDALSILVGNLAMQLECEATEEQISVKLATKLAELSEQRDALPHLEFFAERRTEAAKFLQEWQSALKQWEESPAPPDWEVFAKDETEEAGKAEKVWDEAKRILSELQGHLKNALERQKRFGEAGDGAVCLYCGQAILPGQRTQIEADFAAEIAELKKQEISLKQSRDSAEGIYRIAQEALRNVQEMHARQREQANRSEHAEQQKRSAWETGWANLIREAERIPKSFSDLVILPRSQEEAEEAGDWLEPGAFPTSTYLEEMRVAVKSLPDWEKERANLQETKNTYQNANLLLKDRQQEQEAANSALPVADQKLFQTAYDERTAYEALKAEQEQLRGSEERLDKLQNAERSLSAIQGQLAENLNSIERIPEAHRVPVMDAAAKLTVTKEQFTDADVALNTANDSLKTMQRYQERRAKLEQVKQQAETRRDQYKKLADWLGREGVQRELIRFVEGRILEYANETLGRFSGGNLHLACREDDGSRGAGSALDLVCHNYETGGEALLLKLLSGSQKFRVSVALALGIGQFLSGDNAQPRSVIIDEGFGSLDPNGLRDMAEAIRNLGEVLERIIVVSHQQEFAEAFSDRYHIRLVNGCSCPERNS
ncbi:MAG: hypothetical protein OHK0029_05850 [Armatimonadaceae bacterium]